MTAKPSSTLYEPTALGRTRMLALATALALVIVAGLASTSRADVGSVYFDANFNAAAGETLFNGTFTGTNNAGLGRSVMPALTSGCCNVAIGNNALLQNTTGSGNIAAGDGALFSNTTGRGNVATGDRALFSNTTGDRNVAAGNNALIQNTTGSNNIAAGDGALFSNTTGNTNFAAGDRAMFSNTTGDRNVALGKSAGGNLTTGSNNIAIANGGRAGESRTIRIGTDGTQTAAFIAGISGEPVPGPDRVVRINAQGQLGTEKAEGAGALSATVNRLKAELRSQQRQIARLREQVKGG